MVTKVFEVYGEGWGTRSELLAGSDPSRGKIIQGGAGEYLFSLGYSFLTFM